MPDSYSLSAPLPDAAPGDGPDAPADERPADAALDLPFRTLADALPQIVWTTDAAGRVGYLNQRWFDYTGLGRKGDVAAESFNPIHPDDRPHATAAWADALARGAPYELEMRLRRADGVYRWFLARTVPVAGADGRVARWFGTSTDIHERRAGEDALRESEGRFRTLAGALPQIVWTSDAHDETDYLNERWAEFTGLPAEDATPARRHALIHPDDRARALAVRRDGAARGEPYEAEFRLRRADGTYRWVLGRAVPVRDGDGRVVRWFGTFTDIEDRRRAEERRVFLLDLSADLGRIAEPDALVREGVERLRVWLGATSCSLYLFEPDGDAFVLAPQVATGDAPGRLRVPAAAFARDFERLAANDMLVEPDTSAEADAERAALFAAVGTGAYLTVPVVRGGQLAALLSLRERGPRAWTPAEAELARRVAELVWPAYENALLLQGLEAERARLQSLAHTLEARVAERTARLAAQGDELAARNRELHEFSYAASHDLRAPLRTMHSFADLLAADYGDRLGDEGRAFLDRLRAAAQRMDRLLTDLLAYTRVSTHTRPFEPVRLAEVAENVVADLGAALAESGGAVTVGALPEIEADPSQMHQLLQNLVGNGLKFHRAGAPPRVSVTAETDAGRARITVRDEGIGFDERYAERIFAPFQRLHGQAAYEGVGVGLAICRRIAERHGGTITARSREGAGAAFVVTLPLRQGGER